jgi:hypothetical protein
MKLLKNGMKEIDMFFLINVLALFSLSSRDNNNEIK